MKAVHKGVIKVMSKMGISTLQSYRGAQIFEAVGLSDGLIDRYFTWTPSRIGGIGIGEIENESARRHESAYPEHEVAGNAALQAGGQYQWRHNRRVPHVEPRIIANVQKATRLNDPKTFSEFTRHIDSESRRLCTIRGLLEFKLDAEPIPLDEVEPASEIVRRFATGAVSLGVHQPRGTRDDGHRNEQDQGAQQHGGGWGGPGEVRVRAQRRVPQQRHEAGRIRQIRGDERLPGERK